MKTIVLCCAGGMSSSLLVQRMQHVADDNNLPYEIKAYSVSAVEAGLGDDAVCVLIGPQVGYNKQLVEEANPSIPVDVINMADYGRMRAGAVLNTALKMLGEDPVPIPKNEL